MIKPAVVAIARVEVMTSRVEVASEYAQRTIVRAELIKPWFTSSRRALALRVPGFRAVSPVEPDEGRVSVDRLGLVMQRGALLG